VTDQFAEVPMTSRAEAVKVESLFGYAESTTTQPLLAFSTNPPPSTCKPAGHVAVALFGLLELLADEPLTRM
jgi:hypothetical protein